MPLNMNQSPIVLIHNTDRNSARSILKQQKINSKKEESGVYGVNSGPFFYVEGHEGRELPSGGELRECNLFFECILPIIILSRPKITRALANFRYENLRGHIVIGMGLQWGVIEQAIIVPNERRCLTLIRVETTSKSRIWNRISWKSKRGLSFDVALPLCVQHRGPADEESCGNMRR